MLKMITLFSFIISAKGCRTAIPGHLSASGSRCHAMLPENHSRKVHGQSHPVRTGQRSAATPKLPLPRTECVPKSSHLRATHATLHLAHRASTDPLARNPLQAHPGYGSLPCHYPQSPSSPAHSQSAGMIRDSILATMMNQDWNISDRQHFPPAYPRPLLSLSPPQQKG